MKKLNLLFTKDGLQYQITKGKSVLEENSWFCDEQTPKNYIENKLDEVLTKDFSEISMISALNQFSLMPAGFSEHEMGYDLIGYNAKVDKEKDELMLSINKKYDVQFYFLFPKVFYKRLKEIRKPAQYNFSGEKFLQLVQPKNRKEIHINLYENQCEFFAFDQKKPILYNNLDVNSEVDFLYFIMFTISKINFGIKDTHFFVYGETSYNETFISELKKFVPNLKIGFDNVPKKKFILQTNH